MATRSYWSGRDTHQRDGLVRRSSESDLVAAVDQGLDLAVRIDPNGAVRLVDETEHAAVTYLARWAGP